jgi:hypothetical protein
MRQGSRMAEAPKEGEAVARSPDKAEYSTKAEYNRALLRNANWQAAEEMRAKMKDNDEMIKERTRKHTAQGLSRQQAAAVQMKKASESLEAHRQQNLTLGRQVYEEVSGWRMGAKASKDQWSAYGKGMRDAVREAKKTEESVAEMSAKKKAIAAKTRADDEAKAKQLEEMKTAKAAVAKDRAATVRAATADAVIDASRRHFYEQRLKVTQETKALEQQWEKDRQANKEKHQEAQNKKRSKVRAVKANSGSSKSALATARQQEAAQMREAKRALAEEHKRRMQEEYQEKSAFVKGQIANTYVQPADSLDPGSPASSFYSLTNIRPPSPEAER